MIERNHGLDLVKWIALITMVIDHLRLVWPELAVTFIPGRISFPFFCLAIAANVARGTPGRLATLSNGRYITFMVFFSLISEVPYQLFLDSETFNVFPSLTLGLLVALGLYQRIALGLGLALATLVVAFILEQDLMYGVYGVLLPTAFVLAIKRPALPALALIPAVTCVLLNSRQGALDRAMAMNAFAILTLLTAFLSAIVGLWLIQRPIKLTVWRVRLWGYWFYPAHLAALQAVRAML
ncbi:TraX family protein [Pseudomonas viridiflava]|uniref:TraX family protein n=1 Tax=Pseudomonas viridiflava TaxID=33069 RepID=UPI002F35FC8F